MPPAELGRKASDTDASDTLAVISTATQPWGGVGHPHSLRYDDCIVNLFGVQNLFLIVCSVLFLLICYGVTRPLPERL
jgi:hypothetical protein